jgi:hypothetical protein
MSKSRRRWVITAAPASIYSYFSIPSRSVASFTGIAPWLQLAWLRDGPRLIGRVEGAGQEAPASALPASLHMGYPRGMNPRAAGVLGLPDRGRLIDIPNERLTLGTGVATTHPVTVHAARRAPGTGWAVVVIARFPPATLGHGQTDATATNR